MASRYDSLHRATIDSSYLHSNSTTHSFIFGALAELLDNSRDAGAKTFSLSSVSNSHVQGGYMLYFLDDGCGMDTNEAMEVMAFGRSSKRVSNDDIIGMYGNGLKSGSMRIARDMILFTKKNHTLTCVLLSRSFLEAENLESIIVPVPAFDATTKLPIDSSEKHHIELNIITKYSPFKTQQALLKQFDMIKGDSGTLVISYNLRLIPTGETELDITDEDIFTRKETGDLTSDQSGSMSYPERKSFSAYAAILYSKPWMKIYVQHKKVRTLRLLDGLYKQHVLLCTSKSFKKRAEHEALLAQNNLETAKIAWQEAQGMLSDMQKRNVETSRQSLMQHRLAVTEVSKKHADFCLKKSLYEQKARGVRELKLLQFSYGLNIADRRREGLFIYNRGRLVKMYEPILCHNEYDSDRKGVIGIADVSYSVLEPTHNKQDFANAKDFRKLKQLMIAGVDQYFEWVSESLKGNIGSMWKSFGYLSPNWQLPPSDDPVYAKKRARALRYALQCDKCLKWRYLPFTSDTLTLHDSWECADNVDSRYNSCQAGEEVLKTSEDYLAWPYKRATDDKPMIKNKNKSRLSKESFPSNGNAILPQQVSHSWMINSGQDSDVEVIEDDQEPQSKKIRLSKPRPMKENTTVKKTAQRKSKKDCDRAMASLSVDSTVDNTESSIKETSAEAKTGRNDLHKGESKMSSGLKGSQTSLDLDDILYQSDDVVMASASGIFGGGHEEALCCSTTADAFLRDKQGDSALPPAADVNSNGNNTLNEKVDKVVALARKFIDFFALPRYEEQAYGLDELAAFDFIGFSNAYVAKINKLIKDREAEAVKDMKKQLGLLMQVCAGLPHKLSKEQEEDWMSLSPTQLVKRMADLTNGIAPTMGTPDQQE